MNLFDLNFSMNHVSLLARIASNVFEMVLKSEIGLNPDGFYFRRTLVIILVELISI